MGFDMTRSIALILPSWIIAAFLVAAMPGVVSPAFPLAIVVAKIAAVVVVAFAYVKMSGGLNSLNEALLVSAAWLLLDIAAEMAVTIHTGHAWFALLGSPASPVLRGCVLLAWIAAPALFARRMQNQRPTATAQR
ncbi:MAG: hypothetical protein JJE51_10500 [Thermoanaerobaculia bacterium]|nr:hypothetical protein [Thermoanaerobaculia bacterium]